MAEKLPSLAQYILDHYMQCQFCGEWFWRTRSKRRGVTLQCCDSKDCKTKAAVGRVNKARALMYAARGPVQRGRPRKVING